MFSSNADAKIGINFYSANFFWIFLKNLRKSMPILPPGSVTYLCRSSLLFVSRLDGSHWADTGASAAVYTEIRVNVIDITLGNSS